MWLLSGDDELDVGSLAARVSPARPAVSQHLAKLELAGLVVRRRVGRRMLYRTRGGHVRRLLVETLNAAEHQSAEYRSTTEVPRPPAVPGRSFRPDSAGRFGAVGEAQAEVFAVVDRLVEQLGDVAVVEAVDDAAPAAGAGDQAEVAQEP